MLIQLRITRQLFVVYRSSSRAMADWNLGKYLEQNSTNQYFIEYGGYLTNHLAHGFIALHRLGAAAPRLERFGNWYTPRLESVQSDIEDSRPFEELKGQRAAYYTILKHYEDLLKSKYENNVDSLLKEEYPKLSLGLSGSALHGTIHLGYGYSTGSIRTVLEGLAYTYHSYRPLESHLPKSDWDTFGPGDTDILTVLSKVKANAALCKSIKDGRNKDQWVALKVGSFQRCVAYLLGEQGDQVLRYALSIKLGKDLRYPDGSLDPVKLSRRFIYWAMCVYVLNKNANDFFFLHGVTCAWSLYQIIHTLTSSDAINVMRDYAAVVIAVYITGGAPALDAPIKKHASITEDDWNAVVKETVEADRDEHCYKMVQVCKEMAKDAADFDEDVNVYMQAARIVLDHPFYYHSLD